MSTNETIGWTPEPWMVDDGGDGEYEVWAPNSDTTICRCGMDPDDSEADAVIAANANLMAAAPDLYRALEAIIRSAGYESGQAEPTLRELNVGTKALDAARLALAKARGTKGGGT